MNKKASLISIIIPVYNRELLINETLKSISKQSYVNWECIIVDDYSTDNTVVEIKKHIELDNRFKLLKRPADRVKGACSCRNYGFEKSKGLYINFFDSDDIMHEDFLKHKIELLESKDYLDGVLSKTAFFKEDVNNIFNYEKRTKLTKKLLEDFLSLKVSWYLCDILWKRIFLANKKLFEEHLLMGQDRNFHIKMLADNPKLELIDKYITFYRKHNDSISAKYFSSKYIEMTLSHLKASIEQLAFLKERNLLSNSIKTTLFKSGILYLPYTYNRKINFELICYLKQLFVFNRTTIKNSLLFFLAFIVYSITGRGFFILKL